MAGAPQPVPSARIILTLLCFGSGVTTDPQEADQKLYVSPQPVQWIEGQRLCAERGQRLLNSEDFTHSELQEELVKFRPKSQFWIGDVKRVSEWIYILGCYHRSSIQHLLSNPFEFTEAMSPARCQETCWNGKKSRYFAVRQNQCYCLPADANLSSGRLTQISECNHQCGFEEPKACGSNGNGTALNVYKTSNASDSMDKKCCQIECSGNKGFTATLCSQILMPYCSTAVKEIGAHNWDDANTICRQNGGYLDGRADLDYPIPKCNEIQTTYPNQYVFWVGIRRQSFHTLDTGYPVDFKTVEECQYFDTNDTNRHVTSDCTVQKYSVCVNTTSTKNSDGRISEFPSEDTEDTERGDTGSIVGGVLVAVFIVATILISLILYIRWRRSRLLGAQTKLEYTRAMAQKGSRQDPRGADRAEETGTEDEVYYGSNDDYDVLGGRRLKANTGTENVYNQTEDACIQNDYAHTDQFSKRKSTDDDNLYDHTTDDKYGTIVTTDDNSSMYGQSDS